MKVIKLFVLMCCLCLLSACGVGEFFVKRTVNGLQQDIASEFKSFADFTKEQEQEIEAIARDMALWVRRDRLPVMQIELERIALDIETEAKITAQTWASLVALLEQPMNLSEQDGLVEKLALLVYGMTEQQIQQALLKMSEEREEELEEREEQTADERKDKIVRGLRLAFAELDIKRSRAQIKQARKMLDERKSHIDLEHAANDQNYATFVKLLQQRSVPENEYVSRFKSAWLIAEAGPKHKAPELWEHNADVAYRIFNYLLSDLKPEQQQRAANNIRRYASLFDELSRADLN